MDANLAQVHSVPRSTGTSARRTALGDVVFRGIVPFIVLRPDCREKNLRRRYPDLGAAMAGILFDEADRLTTIRIRHG